MTILQMALGSALCILPLIGITVIVAYFAMRGKLQTGKQIRRDIENGLYDNSPADQPYFRRVRILIVITWIVVLLMMALSFVMIVSYIFPFSITATTLDQVRAIVPFFFLGIVVLAIVLWILFAALNKRHRKAGQNS